MPSLGVNGTLSAVLREGGGRAWVELQVHDNEGGEDDQHHGEGQFEKLEGERDTPEAPCGSWDVDLPHQ